MNMDDLEAKLRSLEPRPPSDGFAARVIAQRPEDPIEGTAIPWWRRKVAIPVPVLVGLVVLIVGFNAAHWYLARTSGSSGGKDPAAVPVSSQVPLEDGQDSTHTYANGPVVMVSMNGQCEFHLGQ